MLRNNPFVLYTCIPNGLNEPTPESSLWNFHCESHDSPPLTKTISIISPISQCNAVQIFTKDSVDTFSFRPSFAIKAGLIPAACCKSFFFISKSINNFHSFLLLTAIFVTFHATIKVYNSSLLYQKSFYLSIKLHDNEVLLLDYQNRVIKKKN